MIEERIFNKINQKISPVVCSINEISEIRDGLLKY